MRANESQHLQKQMSHKEIRNLQRQHQQQQNASNLPRLFDEEYSFNRPPSDLSAEFTYTQASFEEAHSELHRKYASIYSGLKGIEAVEVVDLFLEELQEHEKTRAKLAASQRQMQSMTDQMAELKELLTRKRESIAQLCMTQSDHLNLIEQLQGQINSKCFSTEGHFQKKYRQLQSYMNEYIASTRQVQEELLKNFKLIKSENARLLASNDELNNLKYHKTKQIEVINAKISRLKKVCRVSKQKQQNMLMSIENLEQKCAVMKKEKEALQEGLKAAEQFKISLAQQNRELSSELDFIREKINESHSIRKDIFDKIEEHHQNSHKLACQIEALQEEKAQLEKRAEHLIHLLDSANQEKAKTQKENELLSQHLDEMKTVLETARSELSMANESLERLKGENNQLREELAGVGEENELLHSAYDQERESKENIKEQLIELANQVRFMEQTYQKELSQHEKIKSEIQRFWQKQQNPLVEISNNPSLEHSPTFEMKSNRSRKSGWENESLGDKENQPIR